MKSSVALVMVGDELLDGRIREANSVYLIDRLTALRIPVRRVSIVDDRIGTIAGQLRLDAAQHAAVIVTGGLGPTSDDLTREALAEVAGEELILDPVLLEELEELFRRRGRHMADTNRRQAQRTPSSTSIPNPRGTAPGLWHEIDDTPIVLLPGVPAELKVMWEATVEPKLRERIAPSAPARRRLRLARVAESVVAGKVQKALGDAPVHVGYCAHRVGLDVLLLGEDDALDAAARTLLDALGPTVFEVGESELHEVLLDALRRRGETVAVAESCTGGLLAARFTDAPGSSDVFVGGTVAYANELKVSALGVPAAMIEREGAVSRAVALSMARAARERARATWGLSATGIAGPGGGTEDKPVGTVWIAVVGPQVEETARLQLPGDRDQNRDWSVTSVLDLLRRQLGLRATVP